jgi:aspartate ammonia-lyase
MLRKEHDSLGEKEIAADALYGIHAARARENFPGPGSFPDEWYRAVGITKVACYKTYNRFRDTAIGKYGNTIPLRIINDEVLDVLITAAEDVAEGKYSDYFIVPALQGGAGTSINMNINEIITNAALLKRGEKCGTYTIIDPVEDANIYQSTNDVIPTSLTVAVMRLLNKLEKSINSLRTGIEEIEKEGRDKLRPGYTQMQEAVPSSFGHLFSSYSDALSRDWWRASKCSERLKTVNAGGGATGTGLSVPRFFIMELITELRKLTDLPLTRAENLADATSNLDKWVEIHATLKANAVNLEKIASDIRLLASDIARDHYLTIPPRQAGSSIMPGKVNPVIPEFVISASHKVYSNDVLVSSLSGQGCLELNAYLPTIGCAVIESINLLIASCDSMLNNLIRGLIINESTGYKSLIFSPSVTTALIQYVGYNKAGELAALMKEKRIDIFEANKQLMLFSNERITEILKPSNLLRLGFTLDDIV